MKLHESILNSKLPLDNVNEIKQTPLLSIKNSKPLSSNGRTSISTLKWFSLNSVADNER